MKRSTRSSGGVMPSVARMRMGCVTLVAAQAPNRVPVVPPAPSTLKPSLMATAKPAMQAKKMVKYTQMASRP